MRRRYPNAGGYGLAALEKVFDSASAEGCRPVMLACLLLLAREALGRSLDWGLWAGGAKRRVLGTGVGNRRRLVVGCPR